MRKVLFASVLLLSVMQGSVAFAHPGRTDSKGGHTCNTNCEKWGLKLGEYHFHEEKIEPKEAKSEAKKEAKKEAKEKISKNIKK